MQGTVSILPVFTTSSSLQLGGSGEKTQSRLHIIIIKERGSGMDAQVISNKSCSREK